MKEELYTGNIAMYNHDRGFGFIQSESVNEAIFFHFSRIEGGKNSPLYIDLNERENVKISVRLPYPVSIITYPLMSLPKSEKGYEEQYQGTCFLPFFEMKENRLTFKVEIDLETLD